MDLWPPRTRLAASRLTSGLELDLVVEDADAFDFNIDRVTRTQPAGRRLRHPDAMRRSGQDHGAGKQRGAPAEEGDQGGDVEDHVRGRPVLNRLAIQTRGELEGVGIGDLVRGDQDGTERAEGVEELAAAPLAPALLDLPVPR